MGQEEATKWNEKGSFDMKVIIINQEPIDVTEEQAQKLMQSVVSGVEVVIVNGEMVKTSTIMGIRKNNEPDSQARPKLMWGELLALDKSMFTNNRREDAGPGYDRYLKAKQRLLGR